MEQQHKPQGRGPVRHYHDARRASETLIPFPVGKGHTELWLWYEREKAAGRIALTHPDFHRLQLEKWIHDRSLHLMGDATTVEDPQRGLLKAIDFGVIERRGWQDQRYYTAGVSGREDFQIDLTQSIASDSPWFGAYDVVICSEVLEHVARPYDAVDTLFYLLKPGGTLLITSPFLWPDHATEDYPDYWRFTEGAWRLLMNHAGLEIRMLRPTAWTYHGGNAYDLMRTHECMGYHGDVEGHTGYMVEAVKPLDAPTGHKAGVPLPESTK